MLVPKHEDQRLLWVFVVSQPCNGSARFTVCRDPRETLHIAASLSLASPRLSQRCTAMAEHKLERLGGERVLDTGEHTLTAARRDHICVHRAAAKHKHEQIKIYN